MIFFDIRAAAAGLVALLCLFAGATQAQTGTVTECEQTLGYNIAKPAADVPAEFSRFSGLWLGGWSNQLCSVLIVENIDKDGTVQAKYAWGRNPNWNINQAGSTALRGKIANGVLTLPSGRATIEFRPTNPTEIAGTYIGGNGKVDKGPFRQKL